MPSTLMWFMVSCKRGGDVVYGVLQAGEFAAEQRHVAWLQEAAVCG
jgi:hypothetical protein